MPIDDDDLVTGCNEELCFLTGHWKIFQHKAQHRYSTDDVVTAWVAYRMGKSIVCAISSGSAREGASLPLRTLDIGCGIGSVLLMTAWLFPIARCIGVEAQPSRAAQASRSIRYNGVSDRVSVRLCDLRDPAAAEPGSFDLVTGTPPYFDVGTGATSVVPV